MFNFKTLRCWKCNSVIYNLPATEVKKLHGSTFKCECCGHMNTVEGDRFIDIAVVPVKFNSCITAPCDCIIA